MSRVLACALLFSTVIPFDQPAAIAATRDWMAVPNTHELWCVDRKSINHDGSCTYWDDQMCDIAAFPISRLKVDCSQDLSADAAYYRQQKGGWVLRRAESGSGAQSEAQLVCKAAGGTP